jgi:HK97 family phage portal protein
MGLRDLFVSQKATTDSNEHMWTGSTNVMPLNVSGQLINADTALTISAVKACVEGISSSLGMLPLQVFERKGEEKVRSKKSYLLDLIKTPNPWMTQMEFVELLTAHALLQGNGYALIKGGRKSFAEQIIPLDPSRMQVEQLNTGRLRYVYSHMNGIKAVYTQDEIFHLKGPGSDGIVGYSVIHLAANSMGLALATEKFGARQFSGMPLMSGLLSTESTLSPEASRRVSKSFVQNNSGQGGWHGVPVLEEGLTWQSTGMKSIDAEFMVSRKFQVIEICRWFRMPPHMIQELERATFNNIESQDINFVRHTLGPWAKRWEQAIDRDLIVDDKLFVEFNFDSLLRGDTVTRYDAYVKAQNNGIMSINEIRRLENFAPVDDGDQLYVQGNLSRLGEPTLVDRKAQADNNPAVSPSVEQEEAPEDKEAALRLKAIAREASSRIAKREATAIQRWAKRDLTDDAWATWVKDTYEKHSEIITQNLCISKEDADAYCVHVANELVVLGPEESLVRANNETWTETKVEVLVSLTGVK